MSENCFILRRQNDSADCDFGKMMETEAEGNVNKHNAVAMYCDLERNLMNEAKKGFELDGCGDVDYGFRFPYPKDYNEWEGYQQQAYYDDFCELQYENITAIMESIIVSYYVNCNDPVFRFRFCDYNMTGSDDDMQNIKDELKGLLKWIDTLGVIIVNKIDGGIEVKLKSNKR